MCLERHGTQANDTRMPALDRFEGWPDTGDESRLLSPDVEDKLDGETPSMAVVMLSIAFRKVMCLSSATVSRRGCDSTEI